MSDILPESVRAGLIAARKAAERRKSRLRIEVGGRRIPVLRSWDEGLAVDAAELPLNRGLVDLYQGPKHLWQCLIVASHEENGERIYEYKRHSPARDRPALDFERPDDAPEALLPR